MEQKSRKENQTADVLPISQKGRSLSVLSNFAIWFACNLVVTTMLTGMMMIPDLALGTAIRIIFTGSVIGVIPLVLVGIAGQKTGLATMVLSRGTFGFRGSLLPSFINVMILVAWSWAQAALGGHALNYMAEHFLGFRNQTLFTILTEIMVVGIALYAIKGIALYEKVAMVLIVAIAGAVIWKGASAIGLKEVSEATLLAPGLGKLTTIAAFDIVVATALSWTPLSADYNRNCKSVKGAAFGTGLGYALGTTLSMGVGALMIGMLLAENLPVSYEPSHVFGGTGFGIAGSLVIFMSVLAANVMCVYSSAMSVLNIFPGVSYVKTVLVIGAVCVAGAVFSGILDAFLNFVYLIGVLFMPIFSIMIADFFVVKKGRYNVEAIVWPEKDKTFQYKNGINWIAILVFAFSAGLAYYWGFVEPIGTGAALPTFLIAFVLYFAVMKLKDRKKSKVKNQEGRAGGRL